MSNSCSLFLPLVLLTTLTSLLSTQATPTKNGYLGANPGDNVTLVCQDSDEVRTRHAVNWVKGPHLRINNQDGSRDRMRVTAEGNLNIFGVVVDDGNLYTCQDAESNESLHSVLLQIRTVPPAVTNLTVVPGSVFALVTWSLPSDGGLGVTGFALSYRLDKSRVVDDSGPDFQWKTIDDIQPNATTKTVYNLRPNSTYYFKVWARNELGEGKKVSVWSTTTYDQKQIDEQKEIQLKEKEDKEGSYWKIWLVAISVLIVTFAVIGFGISLLLIKNCDHGRNNLSSETTEEEAMELVPHITLNPSFNIDMLEYLEAPETNSTPIYKNGKIKMGQTPRHSRLLEEDEEEINLVNSPARNRQNNVHSSNSSLSRPNG